MSDKTLEDLKVDAHIAVLHTKVDALIEKQKELTHRVRANEKVVASVSLLGVIACTIVGAGYFAPKADAEEYPSYLEPQTQQPYDGMLPDNSATINNWMSKIRQWELEQSIKDPAFDINNALAEYFNGSNDPTEQEELLQFPSDQSEQSIGWRYD